MGFRGVRLDSKVGLYLTGGVGSPLTLDGSSVTTYGGTDILLWKMKVGGP